MKNNTLNIGMRMKRPPAKLLLIVKLTTFLLMIALTQVSAATFAQKLSYSKRGASLKEIFAEIKTQTGYNVLYSPDQIDPEKKVNANFKQAELDQVLEKLIDVKTQEYSIVDKNILIKQKKKGFFDSVAERKEKDISGIVQDEEGNPLPGATVILKVVDKRGMVTDVNGHFVFINAPDKGTLIISMIGRETKEVQYSRRVF